MPVAGRGSKRCLAMGPTPRWAGGWPFAGAPFWSSTQRKTGGSTTSTPCACCTTWRIPSTALPSLPAFSPRAFFLCYFPQGVFVCFFFGGGVGAWWLRIYLNGHFFAPCAVGRTGGIGLMMYGALPRGGIYDVQAALETIIPSPDGVCERGVCARGVCDA